MTLPRCAPGPRPQSSGIANIGWRLAIGAALTLFATLHASNGTAAPEAAATAAAAPGPESPRLRAVAAALHASSPDALEKFWKTLGPTPLIEDVPGHPADALYTFIWHADPGQVALNVSFNGWFPLHRNPGFDSFTRLADSNIWYTSYILPRTAHIRYELVSPKGWHPAADRATYFTMDSMEYETFHDPLNPRLMNWNHSNVSYVEGPDAKTSRFLALQAGVASGTLQKLPIESRILGNRRTLQIYLPPGYGSGQRDFGLLLVYDGNQYTTAIPTPRILDNMIAAHAIAPVVAVFLESPDRDHEFPPNDAFQQFIATELVPQLRKRYRISTDPRRNAVLGSSYGGLAATYTAFTHPGLFGNVISQSGSYAWSPPATVAGAGGGAPNQTPIPRGINPDSGWLIRRIAASPPRRIRFYLDAGIWEGGGMLFANRMLESVLVGKGYPVRYNEADGTHSSFYWMLRLPAGLQAVLAPKR